MHEVFTNAYDHILSKWSDENELNNSTFNRTGRPNQGAIHRMNQYEAQMDEVHEEILRMAKGQEVTYADIVNILTEQKYIETQFELVSYCIGYYGCFTKEMWEHAQKALSDGFFKA